MKTLSRQPAAELFEQYWNDLRSEWFKLEVLQDYGPEDDGPSLQAWLAGDHQTSIELLKTDPEPDFSQRCRQKAAQGVKLLRIHIIERPLTDYMAWELELYKYVSQPLRREQVYLIDKAELADLKIPAGDLMIFDKDRAVLNDYQNGLMTHRTFYEQGDDLSQFLSLREQLISRAKPLK